MVAKKTSASCLAVIECDIGAMWHILENLSMHTKRLSYPLIDGKPDNISMEMSLNGMAVIGIGLYKPYCLWLNDFMA